MATAAAANESRSDLLHWLNDLLQLNLTKIEMVGTGAVLCQVMDSIYGDVQMHKVKFNTIQEYEYINNFKVLQACFTQHAIDKFIPVERLIKLKFQDNLEFLQWMKKFWDANYPGGRYDAISRRKALPVALEGGSSPNGKLRPTQAPPSPSSRKAPPMSGAVRATAVSRSGGSLAMAGSTSTMTPSSLSQLQQETAALNRTVTELRISVDELEKERDFYFNKLREIEIAAQQVTDQGLLQSKLFKDITEILYKTEDGFEAPTQEGDSLGSITSTVKAT